MAYAVRNPSHKYQIALTGAPTGSQPNWSSTYGVEGGALSVDTFLTKPKEGAMAGASWVDVVDAPAVDTTHTLAHLEIYNRSSGIVTVIFAHYNGATQTELVRFTLAIGDVLEYAAGHGWKILDKDGNLQSAGGGGVGAHNLLDGNVHPDTTEATGVDGDIILRDASAWNRLAKPSPDSGVTAFLGFTNGDARPGYKTLYDRIEAAGDLLVGAGVDQVGRLELGSSLQYLRVNSGGTALEYADLPSGGIPKGTSFPGSPNAGDPFIRTDLESGLLCVYDGAQWLTAGEESIEFAITSVQTATFGMTLLGAIRTDYAPYFVRAVGNTQVNTTNDGANYWTIIIRSATPSYGSVTNLLTFTTAGDTAGQAAHHQGIDTPAPAYYGTFGIYGQKTNSPGNLMKQLYQLVFKRIIT